MREKLYARELLTKLVTEKELQILEAVWNEELSIDEKLQFLLKKTGEQSCSSSK